MTTATLTLKTKKDQSLRRFHPWVFSGAIKNMEGDPGSGELVAVESNKGRFLGIGHYQTGSIAVRMLSFTDRELPGDFYAKRLGEAFALRQRLALQRDQNNMHRLVHAEGDGLPGLIVDRYDNHLVIMCYSAGMYLALDEIVAVHRQFFPEIRSIYVKVSDPLKKHHPEMTDHFRLGSDARCMAIENGIQFNVDWVEGQKSGFFLDQRDNRSLLGSLSKGRNVLNTYSYSGGFSLYALKNGAQSVCSVDASSKAIALLEQNLELNGFDKTKHRSVEGDVLEYLKSLEPDHHFDTIVLDPPAFAKHMSARHQAVQGYKRINALAMEKLPPGGLLFTFSCSQVVDKNLFYHTVISAAILVGRKVRILYQLHQPADHPVSAYHPEGEYLKGLVLEVI